MSGSAKILVTGATGRIGGHLVRVLSQRGVAVRALSRDPAKGADLPDPLVAAQLAIAAYQRQGGPAEKITELQGRSGASRSGGVSDRTVSAGSDTTGA